MAEKGNISEKFRVECLARWVVSGDKATRIDRLASVTKKMPRARAVEFEKICADEFKRLRNAL